MNAKPAVFETRPAGFRRCWMTAFASIALAAAGPSLAGDAEMHHHHHHEAAMQGMDHSQHIAAMQKAISRSVVNYTLPDAMLVGDSGQVRLASELDTGGPVLVNFIFTTCTTICPLTSAVFAKVQNALMAKGKPFRLISISIDPEQDTPARLHEFAGRYGAGADWHFLTGDAATIQSVQRAFDAWRGGKMNHTPITYLRAAPGMPWVRYDGMVDADTLLQEYYRFSASMKAVQR